MPLTVVAVLPQPPTLSGQVPVDPNAFIVVPVLTKYWVAAPLHSLSLVTCVVPSGQDREF